MADKVIHGVCRTDLLWATLNGAGLASVEFATKSGSTYTPADLDNGSLVVLDGLKDGEREIYHAIAPTASSKIGEIYLVCAPEVMYDERLNDLADFYNEAGTPARGYLLHTGDVFSVTAEALDGVTAATKAGNIVEAQAGTKAKVVSTATSGSTTIGKIIAVETVGTRKYYVVRVG